MTQAPLLPTAPDGASALDVAVRAAEAAAAEIRRRLPDAAAPDARRRLGLRSKGGWNNVVTEVDRAAEDAALHVLRAAFPDHAIVGEESGANLPFSSPQERGELASSPSPQERGELAPSPSPQERGGTGRGYHWWLDPIDGTRNFASGLPHICVSVGLWADGLPLVGVLLDPIRNETFAAAAGRGATLNGAPASVSTASELQDALLGFDMGYKGPEGKLLLAALYDLWPGFQSARMMGSAALGIAYAGCGRIDLYAHHYLQPWDIAAAIVFVQEAGGVVTDLQGRPVTPESGSIVAGSARLHELFMQATADTPWRAAAG